MATSTTQNQHPRQGYEAVFDPIVDRKYVCPICLAVMRDTVQTKCGHRFCQECIYGIVGMSRRNCIRCPVDKRWINPESELFEDIAIRREILSLKIKCDQHEIGCIWTGDLREKETHPETCQYVLQRCHNKDCEVVIMRQNMAEHLTICPRRQVDCPSCEKRVAHSEMNKHLVLDCPNFPVNCLACGRLGVPRGEISQHQHPEVGDCPQTVVACKFFDVGCSIQDTREKMGQHCRDAVQHHLDVLSQTVKSERVMMANYMKTTTDHMTSLSEKVKKLEKDNAEQTRKMQRLTVSTH